MSAGLGGDGFCPHGAPSCCPVVPGRAIGRAGARSSRADGAKKAEQWVELGSGPTQNVRMRGLRLAWFPVLVLVVTTIELVAAVVVPGVDQFGDKGWGVRVVAYPLLMLVVPVIWWWVRRRRRTERVPYGAFGLIMVPFLSDVTGNWLDLFRDIGWWDDLSHFVHWLFLCAGIGALLAPHVRPRLVIVPLMAGIGAMLALAWELGEWWLFLRQGNEAGGAYEDTLGDLLLGTAGALVAGMAVAWWSAQRRVEPVEHSIGETSDVP